MCKEDTSTDAKSQRFAYINTFMTQEIGCNTTFAMGMLVVTKID
jgi:hypothetical protein